MAELGITGDFGSLEENDDTLMTGTKWNQWAVDWHDHKQWFIRIYYSIRFLKIACFLAFLNQECFHKLILIMYLAFQDNKKVDQHDVKKNEYQNVERKLLKWVLGITYLLVGLLCGLALASMVPMEDVRLMIFVHYCVSASFFMTLLKFMIPLNYKFFKTLYQI